MPVFLAMSEQIYSDMMLFSGSKYWNTVLSFTRLISLKNRWILPKNVKETVDLPDFCKESVPQIQILCTFQARNVAKSTLVRRVCHLRTWREERAAQRPRNPCSRSRSRRRNRRRTKNRCVSSCSPSLFALVISVDKLFEMLVLFFV